MRAIELLTEAKTSHLEHFEDLLLNKGYRGAVDALNYAESVRTMLAQGKGQKGTVSVKFDGSPSVFAGIDPSDGKFFVGTKAVLSKNPKYIKRPADVKKYYGDQPELSSKLLAAYKFLRNLGISGVLQGDLMFTEDDLKRETIDGEDYITFTPNTITYAVPADSDLGREISRAKLGIVFHTTHEPGESLRDTTMHFGVDLSELKDDPNVWVDDATYKDYTGIASLTPEEDKALKKELAAAKKRLNSLGKKGIETIVGNPEFKKHIQPFVNKRVREGEHVGDTKAFVKEFLEYYTESKKKGIEELNPAAQKKREEKIKEKRKFVRDNLSTIHGFIDLYSHLNEIKLILIDKLNTIDSIKSFIKTDDGYEVTNPEGFVAIGGAGDAVKLVDRLSFSRINLTRHS